jgi:hypothetical protein
MDDYIEPDWTDPVSLRHCAERLKMQAAKMATELAKYNRFAVTPVDTDPFANLVADDPATVEARETAFRTERARREIMNALQQAEAEKAQARQQTHTAFYTSPIGRLLSGRR